MARIAFYLMHFSFSIKFFITLNKILYNIIENIIQYHIVFNVCFDIKGNKSFTTASII